VTNLPPGITVTTATTTPPRSSPTDTGTAFIPVLAPRAPAAPVLLTSMDAWQGALDGPQSYSLAYTWADAFFRMGGNRLYAIAVFGAAAAKATATVAGSTSGTALTLTAVDLGDWANGSTGGLSYDIVNGASGGTFRVLVVKRAGVELARTAEASTIQGLVDAINAVTGTALVTATIGGGSGQPATATGVNLAGGSIDRGSITQAQVDAALAKFTADLGPGNVAAPDWQTDAAHDSLLAHAATHNRFAVLDPADTTSKATILTSLAHVQGSTNGSYGVLLAPWVNVPGLSAGGADRAVPGSAVFCGRAAVVDAAESVNQAPAGSFGVAPYATGVRASFSRDTVAGVNDAGDLNAAGANLIIAEQGQVMIFGNRSLVNPTGPEANWLQASNARYRMSLVARAREAARPYLFRKITRTSIEGFHSALEGMLLADYANQDLFGDLDDDRPETAFNVDTATVNTAESVQSGQLKAAIVVRPTRGAEQVSITITAVALTQPVA
jgi:hypothetical protein